MMNTFWSAAVKLGARVYIGRVPRCSPADGPSRRNSAEFVSRGAARCTSERPVALQKCRCDLDASIITRRCATKTIDGWSCGARAGESTARPEPRTPFAARAPTLQRTTLNHLHCSPQAADITRLLLWTVDLLLTFTSRSAHFHLHPVHLPLAGNETPTGMRVLLVEEVVRGRRNAISKCVAGSCPVYGAPCARSDKSISFESMPSTDAAEGRKVRPLCSRQNEFATMG